MSNEEAWIASFMTGPCEKKAGALSDLEALSIRKDIRLMPLQRNAQALLEGLPSLGPAEFTTGNACITCTRREEVRTVLPLDGGTTLFGAPDGLRWLDASWRHTVAVLNQGTDFADTPPCLLFFGDTGALAHQITLPDPAAWEAFIGLVRRHRGCWNCLRHPAAAPRTGSALDCPVWMLRQAWCDAGSERDLEARLDRLGLERILALRALEGLYTNHVPVQGLESLLKGLASSALPVHVQIANRHCIQVLESPLSSLAIGPREWEIGMSQATLRLDPSRLDSIWSVAQPHPGGEQHRFECYDATGERVLVLSSPHDPCPLVHLGWQRVLGRFEGGAGLTA